MMQRASYILLLALAAAGSSADAFKFMSNWQPPKILTDAQKVEVAKTEERFGDKSECIIHDSFFVCTSLHIMDFIYYIAIYISQPIMYHLYSYLYNTYIPAELVVITGCSSGLGRETVKNLLATDKYHVVGAVRDVDKMEAVAEIDEFNMDNFHIMECELNSFESVHKFCEDLKEYQLAKPIDRLICNAGGMFIFFAWMVIVSLIYIAQFLISCVFFLNTSPTQYYTSNKSVPTLPAYSQVE